MIKGTLRRTKSSLSNCSFVRVPSLVCWAKLLAVFVLWASVFSVVPVASAQEGRALPAPGGYGASCPSEPRRTAEQRKVVFQATRNTRDMGGLPVRGGYLKDGMLYRSGALCYATATDVETLSTLNLKAIIDLRTIKDIEQKEGPDRLPPGNSIRVINLPMASKGDKKLGRYYSYALHNGAAVQGFFATLANRDNYPLMFHCSAGKDRTGVMAALTLELLGTDRSIIIDDYLQSQRNAAKLEVHREWLQEVFDLVDTAGGIQPFLLKHGAKESDLETIPTLLTDRVKQAHDAQQ